ncbi:hypothetical protein [Streptococcus dentiloxodontae]
MKTEQIIKISAALFVAGFLFGVYFGSDGKSSPLMFLALLPSLFLLLFGNNEENKDEE